MFGAHPGYREDQFQADKEDNKVMRWKELATKYHMLRMTLANTKGCLTGRMDGATYLIVGLTSAVGKVTGQFKKSFGGESDASADSFSDSLASARIYIEQIAMERGIDLDLACLKHMQEVLGRLDKK